MEIIDPLDLFNSGKVNGRFLCLVAVFFDVSCLQDDPHSCSESRFLL